MAWTLCSKDDVVAVHPIQKSALKDLWSELVEGLIRQHLGTPNIGLSLPITDEKYSGNGTRILTVRNPRIVSVEAVAIEGAALVSTDYAVFPMHIELTNQVFPEGVLNVSVSYTSGSEEVSAAVKLAAIAMLVAVINYEKRMGSDASLKWATPEKQVGEPDPNTHVGLTSHLDRIMKRVLRRDRIRVA